MKIKPINMFTDSSFDDVRYNENTSGICANIKSGNNNIEKRDYSAIMLISLMNKKGILKNELVKESFDEVIKIINSYERNTTL